MKTLMIRIVIAIFCLTFSGSTQSGVFNLSAISRANCINHESITWDLLGNLREDPWIMAMDVLVVYENGRLDSIILDDEPANRQAYICVFCAFKFRIE